MDNDLTRIIAAIEAEKLNSVKVHPNGGYPVCMSKVGTNVCERCNKTITDENYTEVCSAVPLNQRWG